jgi:uncharacterized protein (TIGR01777 family)
MRIVLAGASGFLGTAWRDHLAQQGHEVVRLVRGEVMSANESSWDPMRGQVDQAVIEEADVVACLSGANIAHVPWSASYRRTFVDSRVKTTGTLARAIARSDRKPAFVAQNGISGYGDRGAQASTEDTPTDAEGFMAQLTRDWEAATEPAAEAGARVAVMRTSVVLDRRGGAFKPILLAFRAGVGGPLGSGDQYFSTISLTDWLRAATWLAENDDAHGAYNLSAPNQTTNKEFGRVLGHMVHRPSLFKVPSFAIKAALRDSASDIVGSMRVEPRRLPDEGFEFLHPTLESRLAAALKR